MARPRSSTGNTRNSTTIASGCRMPAAAPCSTRAAMSAVGLQLAAASSDAARKTLIVAVNVARSPNVSISHAVVSIVAVVAARKPAATHCSVSWPTRNSAISAGNATLTIVAARIVEIVPSITVVTTSKRDGAGFTSSAASLPLAFLSSPGGEMAGVRGTRAQRERDVYECIPRVAVAESLGERVELRELRKERQQIGLLQPTCGTFERGLPLAPYAHVAHGAREPLAVRHRLVHGTERVQVLAELPDDQRDRLAFAAQALEDAQRPCGVAGEPCLRQFLQIVACDVGHRALDIVVRELAGRQQQRQLVDLLPRREQVPFATLREERERVASDALAVSRETLGDPRR